MSHTGRQIVEARRVAANTIAAAFLPTEENAQLAAAGAARCVALLIEQRVATGLKPTAGAEALRTVQEAATLAYKTHAKIMQAHEMLAELPGEYKITNFSDPNCPPNEGIVRDAPRLVA